MPFIKSPLKFKHGTRRGAKFCGSNFPCRYDCCAMSAQFHFPPYNKKSRIYGTSDLSDLSIYLSISFAKSDRWEAVGVRIRPLTTKSCDQIGLPQPPTARESNLSHERLCAREAVGVRAREHDL